MQTGGGGLEENSRLQGNYSKGDTEQGGTEGEDHPALVPALQVPRRCLTGRRR